MSVVSVRARDFILALFIRDDGQRFLLGDNGYDFKDSQLHFSANTIENDEVVKQGADGVMLAGQVRRASVQSFDGYIGDATMPKETIEQMRRDFFAFFAKGHHFRVVYVDTARNAWQRKGGYLVDAPEVKELYQIHPEYHVGLNFEDVSYYSYNENSDGDEILANTLAVPVSTDVNGGLEWDENGAVSEPAVIEYDTETAEASGKSISISDAAEAPLASFRLDGETSQNGTPTPDTPVAVKTVTGENVVKISDGQGNEQSYPISLGSIELCKIGDYQDSIYKRGGKWYVHKAVGKAQITVSVMSTNYSNVAYALVPKPSGSINRGNYGDYEVFSERAKYRFRLQSESWDNADFINYIFPNGDQNQFLVGFAVGTTLDQAKEALNDSLLYYQLATPTDTEITNQALITQLNALLNNARTYAGTNNIFTVTPNEQGTLEIGYYTKYQPMVVSGGYVWEDGGSGGLTIVTNESISAVSPVWTVFGPALNPMIENTTTGEQNQYVGMVGEGQTLVVDMGEQTARLDGLNVISNIVGEYLTLAPGSNTLLFSADSDAPASEIGWSEIVG